MGLALRLRASASPTGLAQTAHLVHKSVHPPGIYSVGPMPVLFEMGADD